MEERFVVAVVDLGKLWREHGVRVVHELNDSLLGGGDSSTDNERGRRRDLIVSVIEGDGHANEEREKK